MDGGSRMRRWGLSVAALGVVVMMAASPVQAHFVENTKHLGGHIWKGTVRANALKLFYTKSASDTRFINTYELLWAKVDADNDGATVLRGRGVEGADRTSPGIYTVDFNRNVRACGWVATLNDNFDTSAQPGEIAVELGTVDIPDVLWVRTYSSAGALTDQADSDGFTIQVTC